MQSSTFTTTRLDLDVCLLSLSKLLEAAFVDDANPAEKSSR